jgi:hypothetical protein
LQRFIMKLQLVPWHIPPLQHGCPVIPHATQLPEFWHTEPPSHAIPPLMHDPPTQQCR